MIHKTSHARGLILYEIYHDRLIQGSGQEQNILSIVDGCDPSTHVYDKLPDTDIHSFRRQFAQDLYELRSGRPLPPKEGRLQSADLDREVALYVSRCLGHNRIDIIFGNYIR